MLVGAIRDGLRSIQGSRFRASQAAPISDMRPAQFVQIRNLRATGAQCVSPAVEFLWTDRSSSKSDGTELMCVRRSSACRCGDEATRLNHISNSSRGLSAQASGTSGDMRPALIEWPRPDATSGNFDAREERWPNELRLPAEAAGGSRRRAIGPVEAGCAVRRKICRSPFRRNRNLQFRLQTNFRLEQNSWRPRCHLAFAKLVGYDFEIIHSRLRIFC